MINPSTSQAKQSLQAALLFFLAFAGRAEMRLYSSRLAVSSIPLYDFGKKGVGNVRHDNPDGVGTPRFKAAGQLIGMIVKMPGSSKNPLSSLGGNILGIVQHIGNGTGRDIGILRNVLDCGHPQSTFLSQHGPRMAGEMLILV